MNRRFIIASGGTGGHFYPGFALGRLLNKQNCSVLFVVRKDDPAIRVLQENKLKYQEIDSCSFPRSLNPFKQLAFAGKLWGALRQTRQILRQFKPDVAVGTGGYISFPLIFSAHCMGIKTVVHDSNTKIGLSNRICSHFTNLFLLGLPVTRPLPHAQLVGTPIRREFAEPVDRAQTLTQLGLNPDFKTVLLFGGSQGARSLNQALIAAVKQLVAENERLQFIHISGERWYQSISNRYGKTRRVLVLPYSNEIYDLMHACDLAVCRSGAGTLAELVYCKKPAILVPLPTAAANHQFYNAKILQSVGCAALVEQSPQLENELYILLDRILNAANNCILQTMQANFAKLDLPDPMQSAENIARLLKKL